MTFNKDYSAEYSLLHNLLQKKLDERSNAVI